VPFEPHIIDAGRPETAVDRDVFAAGDAQHFGERGEDLMDGVEVHRLSTTVERSALNAFTGCSPSSR
jgi:hypothetical protein